MSSMPNTNPPSPPSFDDATDGSASEYDTPPSLSSLSLSSPDAPADKRQECLDEATAAELVPRIRGLVRLCRLSKVLERYRARLTDTLKGVVKTVLLEYLDLADYGLNDDSGHDLEESPIPGAAAAGGGGSGAYEVSKIRQMHCLLFEIFHRRFTY